MDQASFSLDSLSPSDSTCPHCGSSGESVSHGYVYKQRSDHCQEIVGKRILCSRRYGRSGCGRTRQWYLKDVLPGRRYRLSVLIVFINALLGGSSVEHAYLTALGFPPHGPRQGWRWLQRLMKQLSRWRITLSLKRENVEVTQRSANLKKLLPTLQALLDKLGNFNHIQTHYQHAFC